MLILFTVKTNDKIHLNHQLLISEPTKFSPKPIHLKSPVNNTYYKLSHELPIYETKKHVFTIRSRSHHKKYNQCKNKPVLLTNILNDNYSINNSFMTIIDLNLVRDAPKITPSWARVSCPNRFERVKTNVVLGSMVLLISACNVRSRFNFHTKVCQQATPPGGALICSMSFLRGSDDVAVVCCCRSSGSMFRSIVLESDNG